MAKPLAKAFRQYCRDHGESMGSALRRSVTEMLERDGVLASADANPLPETARVLRILRRIETYEARGGTLALSVKHEKSPHLQPRNDSAGMNDL
jgi:hypothetical protein